MHQWIICDDQRTLTVEYPNIVMWYCVVECGVVLFNVVCAHFMPTHGFVLC